MNVYTIRPIVTGYTHTHKGTYVYHHSTHKYYDAEGYAELPVTVFLVEGNGKKIMIDTGMSCTEIAHKYHHPGSYQPEGYAIHEQLEKLGIKPEEIAIALAPFGQIESALSRKNQGTGLGLPLTRALVELHGGTLNLESEVGKGTTVTLVFPKDRVIGRIG